MALLVGIFRVITFLVGTTGITEKIMFLDMMMSRKAKKLWAKKKVFNNVIHIENITVGPLHRYSAKNLATNDKQ